MDPFALCCYGFAVGLVVTGTFFALVANAIARELFDVAKVLNSLLDKIEKLESNIVDPSPAADEEPVAPFFEPLTYPQP